MGRECRKCGETKPLEEFALAKGCKDGRRRVCKGCRVEFRPESYKEKDRVRARQWILDNPERVTAKGIELHGITQEQYDALLEAQGGVCAICHQPEKWMLNGKVCRLSIDHDHDHCDGSYGCKLCVRALLCRRCNTTLGLMGDDVNLVMMIAAYLIEHETGAYDDASA